MKYEVADIIKQEIDGFPTHHFLIIKFIKYGADSEMYKAMHLETGEINTLNLYKVFQFEVTKVA
jgi:hypothetical protein